MAQGRVCIRQRKINLQNLKSSRLHLTTKTKEYQRKQQIARDAAAAKQRDIEARAAEARTAKADSSAEAEADIATEAAAPEASAADAPVADAPSADAATPASE